MKNYDNDDKARDDHFNGSAGGRVIERARGWARECGEAFVVFVGSVGAAGAVRAFREQDDAVKFAREERELHRGLAGAPDIRVKRIKV